jgi:hypothetical protein
MLTVETTLNPSKSVDTTRVLWIASTSRSHHIAMSLFLFLCALEHAIVKIT